MRTIFGVGSWGKPLVRNQKVGKPISAQDALRGDEPNSKKSEAVQDKS